MNNRIIYNIFLFLIAFFIFLIISKIYIDYFDLNRHWSSNFDQELTFTYNALLFNSGIKHEFIDHSAYFTILFLSIFIKISEILNLTQVYNLRIFLEQNVIDKSLQDLIIFTRIYAGVSVAVWALVVNILFYKISKSKIFSFLLTLVLFTMPGTIEQVFQLRTELISSLFMILSLIIMISYFENKNSQLQVLRLIFFFIFLYSAILNKSQIFFYFPYILLIALFFHTKITQISLDFLKDLSDKKYLIYFILVTVFYISLKLLVYKGSIFSLIFILLNILIFILIFYYLAKKSQINEISYINHLYLILIISFVIFKSVLFIHPSTNEMAFNNTFTNILGVLKYSTIDIANSQLNNSSFLSIILSKIYTSIMYYFSSLNSYSILISIIILINLIFKKIIGNKYFILNFICILVPIIFTFIGSFRHITTSYFIFWDFIFLLPFCIFYQRFKSKLAIILILILLAPTYFNYHYLISFKKEFLEIENNTPRLCNELREKTKNSYLEAFHKKIPREKFVQYCKNNYFN